MAGRTPKPTRRGAAASWGNDVWAPHLLDFLALIHSMRLSLMKGARADLSGTAWQESVVKPCFGLSGTPQRWTRLFCHEVTHSAKTPRG
jgi:hypothetical protein